MLRKEFFIIFT